jgi:hypothetical protein
MRTIFRLIPFSIFALLGATSAFAVTHAVLPGASIQAKIDIAVAGDIVAIFGGTYNQDITINKAIRLVEVSGQQVTLAGSVTFTGVANCPVFDGFTVGSSGRGISVANTTGLVFRNLDARAGSGVTTSGTTNLKISDSQLSSLTAGGSTVELAKTSLTGGINQTAGNLNVTEVTVAGNFETADAAQKTVAFRTTVTGHNIWRSKKSWFGYGKMRSFNYYGSAGKVVFVGNEINRQGEMGAGFYTAGVGSQYFIFNSIIQNIFQESAIRITDSSCYAVAQNNWLSTFHGGAGVSDRTVKIDQSTNVFIRNNIFDAQNDYWNKCIYARFGVEVSGNMISSATQAFSFEGGVLPLNTNFNAIAQFIDNEAPKLQSTSPCLNAGTPDPRYNDRDGSRNDIGPSGGAWFDPDGWTTENPVVISFDLSPDMVLEGVDTEVILSEGQAVSAP